METAQSQRVYLRSLFGAYTNLTVDFSVWFHGEILFEIIQYFYSSFSVRIIIMVKIVKYFVYPMNNVIIVISIQDKKFVNKDILDKIVLMVEFRWQQKKINSLVFLLQIIVLVKINHVWIMEHVLNIFEDIYVNVKKDTPVHRVRLVSIRMIGISINE